MSATVVCTIGTMPPPPMPCSVRPTISITMLLDTAQSAEPAMNSPMAASIMARRPWMSESLP
jgi:hypothetical protein